MLRTPCWLVLAGIAPLLYGADQAWFTRAWTTDDGLPNNHVTAVVQYSEGDLYVATRNRAARFDGVHFTPVASLSLDPDVVRSLRAVTAAGEIWLVRGSSVGVLRGGEFTPVVPRTNARIAAAHDGGLWIASDANLAKRTPDGSVSECGNFETDGPRPHVMAVMEDRAGAVWIGTATNGLFRYDGVSFQKIETSYSYILCLAEDSAGNLWVGTDGGGLDRITPRFISLERYSSDQSAVGIQSLCEDTAGNLWGVTQNRWLVRREANGWQRAVDEGLQAVDAPLCVAADRHRAVWIGTARRCFFRWQDGQLTRWGVGEGFTSFSVHSFLPATNGDLWIAAYNPNDVQRLRGDKLESLALPASMGAIHAMCEDAAGNIWIGTDGGLLVSAQGSGSLTAVAIPDVGLSLAVMCLVATPDGTVWAGGAGGGLIRIRAGHAKRVGADQGLPDGYISQMIDDGLGWLWIGSANHGIFKVRLDQLEQALLDRSFRLRPIIYGRNEGLSHLEAYGAHSPDAIGPSAIRTRDGRIWIPMRTALAVVQPKVLREDTQPPLVRLNRVAVDGAFAEPPLQVNPSHRRIDFEFSVINLLTPDNAHVRYRLDGIDADWVDAVGQRIATYSRLAAGTYTFRLQSANFDGSWHDARDPIRVVVLPFYWQTWWFRLTALTLFTAATAGVVHRILVRRLRAKHRILEEQSALDRERARIARDLHDDLGGTLTQVGVMLDLAQKGVPDASHAELGRCVGLVRGAAQSVDEIIWAINPRNDTLRYLIDYLSQFVVEFFHAANVECSINLPDAIPDRPMTPETRHHLLLAVKECATNVARHAQATEVRFHVETDDNGVTIVLEDNGAGFGELRDNSTSDGLRNIRHRMSEIGGSFQIESHPGSGTRACLTYLWPCR